MPDIMPWHKTYLEDPEYVRVDLVKEGANSQAKIKLFKSREGGNPMIEEVLKALKPEHRDTIEKTIAAEKQKAEDALAEVQKELDDTKAELEIAKSAEEITKSTSEEEILKTIKDPAVRAILETQIAKTKAAEAEVQKARDIEATTVAIAKAKEVPNLGADEAVLAEVYKKLKAKDAELCEEVFGIFKASNALIAEGGVFTEIGKSSGNNTATEGTDENAAWGKIEKAAEALVTSDKITKSAAISRIIKENPAMYDAYVKAQQG